MGIRVAWEAPGHTRLAGQEGRHETRRFEMADQQDRDQARTDAEKAKDYFSKLPGFQPAVTEKPAPNEAEEEGAPAVPAKPEPPLSEAEKYFKGLMGK